VGAYKLPALQFSVHHLKDWQVGRWNKSAQPNSRRANIKVVEYRTCSLHAHGKVCEVFFHDPAAIL
jgi:hypothetical protein